MQININTKPLSDMLGRMLAQIDHFKRVDIGIGLSDFQVQDMHRNRPFTMRSRARGMATTKIRPHSLYEMERAALQQRRIKRVRLAIGAGKRVRAKSLRALRYVHYSTRPILREEMLAVLDERMHRMLIEKITWKNTKEK
jgi:hypothetical protein